MSNCFRCQQPTTADDCRAWRSEKINKISARLLRRFQSDSLLSALGVNQMPHRVPCVAFHKLLGQIFVLRSNSLQQRRHLCIHFCPKQFKTVKKVKKVEVRHRLQITKLSNFLTKHVILTIKKSCDLKCCM